MEGKSTSGECTSPLAEWPFTLPGDSLALGPDISVLNLASGESTSLVSNLAPGRFLEMSTSGPLASVEGPESLFISTEPSTSCPSNSYPWFFLAFL